MPRHSIQTPLTCAECGRPFKGRARQRQRPDAAYCGKSCSSAATNRRRTKPAEERFWKRVNKDGPLPVHRPGLGRCWIWTGHCSPEGYGRIQIDKWPVSTHRFSLELAQGFPIPDGLWALHHCDNPPCVRPDHLYAGTISENHRDMVGRDRHMWGLRNGNAKLTTELVVQISIAYRGGESQRAIAERLGFDSGTIGRALKLAKGLA